MKRKPESTWKDLCILLSCFIGALLVALIVAVGKLPNPNTSHSPTFDSVVYVPVPVTDSILIDSTWIWSNDNADTVTITSPTEPSTIVQ